MALESVIEYIGTPIGVTVLLSYGINKMYKHFKDENKQLKDTIKEKDTLIEQINKEHLANVTEMIENNTKINTEINEAIRNFQNYINKID